MRERNNCIGGKLGGIYTVAFAEEEVHYQRAYDLKTIDRLLADAGMELLAAYDAFTKEPVKEDSERIYVVARPRR